MRLQGKETVYKVDVELDQIMTFFRVGLVNLCSYFAQEILGTSLLSLSSLVNTILLIPALIEVTKSKKIVTLKYNPKTPDVMSLLELALNNINKLEPKTPDGKQIEFKLGEIDYHLKSTVK